MRRLIQLSTRLYPASWQQRYREEFHALLEEMTPRWRDVFNILQGAIQMQLRSLELWKLAAALGLVGALAGGAVALSSSPSYTSTAILRSSSPAVADPFSIIAELARAALSDRTLASVIEHEHLYESTGAKASLPEAVAKMKKDIRLSSTGSNGLSIEFRYRDAAKGISAMNALRERVTLAWQNALPGEVRTLDIASLPAVPSGPDYLGTAGLGLAFGVLVAIMTKVLAGGFRTGTANV